MTNDMNPQFSNSSRFSFKRLMPAGIGSDPYVDWSLIVASATLIVIALIYAGYAAYATVGDRLATGASIVSARINAGFDMSNLSKLSADRVRADAARAAALQGYSGPSDPAI